MTPPERPPERPATILRSDELRQLRQAESILRDAETARRDSETAAAAEAQSVLTEARQKALRDSARTAARLIAQAEAKAQERLVGLEPELARLVAHTVRQIVGDFAREEATYHAALTALRQFREHRRGRVFAAPDIAAPIDRAVEDAGASGPEILDVHTDHALEPGRAVLTSDQGSAEIGLGALTDQALRAWEAPAATDRHAVVAPPATSEPAAPLSRSPDDDA